MFSLKTEASDAARVSAGNGMGGARVAALAQPLPETIRSAGLTQAQADELNRRLAVIDNGAHKLRTLLTEARGRSEGDPELATLRAQAIAAAEEGRLGEARATYDRLIARSTEPLEARWAREDAARTSAMRARAREARRTRWNVQWRRTGRRSP